MKTRIMKRILKAALRATESPRMGRKTDYPGQAALAKLLGVSRQRVHKWKKIPPEFIIKTEEVTGIDRTIIDPKMYPPKDSNRG